MSEALIRTPLIGTMFYYILVQLTLQGVLDKCEGTNFEEPIRKCIMKCVYTGCKLEKEINKVMNQYYEV